MKKTLFLLIAVAALFLSSCQKKYCWRCIISTSFTGTTNNQPATITNTNVCDKSEKEIKAYEQAMTTHSSSGNIRVSQSTVCQHQ